METCAEAVFSPDLVTDNGREYYVRPVLHPYELYLSIN